MPHKSTLYDIPFDLWSEIASFTSIRDLARLSATSSTLQSTIRPLLYRVVTFGSTGDYRPALDLLARDKALASVVVRLVFTESHIPSQLYPLRRTINLDAIANLTNLRHFQIGGSIFRNDVEQSEFWRILASKSPLEQLTYSTWEFDPRLPWHGDGFGGLGDLKVVQWRPRSIEDLNPLRVILSRSLQTLSSLALPSFVFEGSQSRHLANMHFPNLRSLAIHPHSDHILAVDESGLAAFLMPHDTLEELRLHAVLTFNVSKLTANSFPRLRYFKGISSSFEAMLLAGMTCLSSTLRRVTIRFSSFDAHHCNRIFALLQSLHVRTSSVTEALPMLREIEVLDDRLPLPLLQDVIRHCERGFGLTLEAFAAEVRTEDLEAGQLTQLAPLFQPFSKLRVIDIMVTGFEVYLCTCAFGAEDDGLAAKTRHETILSMSLLFVRKLFHHCAALEEVRMNFVPLHWKHTWIVARKPDSSGERCPSYDCTGHLIHVPYMTSSGSRTPAAASVDTTEENFGA